MLCLFYSTVLFVAEEKLSRSKLFVRLPSVYTISTMPHVFLMWHVCLYRLLIHQDWIEISNKHFIRFANIFPHQSRKYMHKIELINKFE